VSRRVNVISRRVTDGSSRPAQSAAGFVAVIVKMPLIQIVSMLLGMSLVALEFPVPIIKKTVIHRSIVLRVVLLLFQTFLAILFYQVREGFFFELGLH
jgi:hypothetical protein